MIYTDARPSAVASIMIFSAMQDALQNLFNEIYLRDITKRNRVRNIGELEDLLNILSSAIGSLTNPEKLKNTFKTVKKSRITFRQFEQTHSMENVIYNELRMRGYSVDVGVIPIAERNQTVQEN